MSVQSIHHVTAITADITKNLEFYTKTLGLRLVKRSVNQDDVSAYHLFYADAAGTPGTDITFFDWPNVGNTVPGPGTVSLTSFRVMKDALDWWHQRLEAADAAPFRDEDAFGRESILFTDPEGQRLELVDETGMEGRSKPWAADVPEEMALRGILGVEIESARPDSTERVLTELLGYQGTSEGIFETGDEDHHARIRVLPLLKQRLGKVGAGGVHHVAFRVQDDDELNMLKERIEAAGLGTSGFIDRFYFHSLYFREPGGILFELATDGPGFASDEDEETLGQKLALPPFLEDRRAEIEAGLKPL